MKSAGIVIFIVFLCAGTVVGQDNSNKAVIEYYIEEVINNRNLDGLNNVFADTFVANNLNANTSERNGVQDQRTFLEYFYKAFPDIHYTILDIVVEGNKVAARFEISGTHKDEFWGYEAKGSYIDSLNDVYFFNLEDGKIVEVWYLHDLQKLDHILSGNKGSLQTTRSSD